MGQFATTRGLGPGEGGIDAGQPSRGVAAVKINSVRASLTLDLLAYGLVRHPDLADGFGCRVVGRVYCLCHGTEDIAEWLRIQARRFVGANADDLIRINTSEVHLIDSLRRQIQELEHRVESLTPETSYENYGKSDAELKALFATTKEEATHNGIEFLMHGKNMAFKIGNQMFAMAYEPDEPGDFEFMKGALLHALSTITPNVKVTFLAKLDQANTKDAIAQVVDRFLGWKLPKDFGPDAGISFTPPPNPEWWPTGTNLFTAVQTKQMLEYLLSASPAAPEAAKPGQQAQAEPEVVELDCGCRHCGMSLSKIAKQDAALKACVAALEMASSFKEGGTQLARAAITQAEGARK